MDHLYHHQSLPVSKGQTGVSGDNNNSSSNNNNWSTSLGSTSSRHQTAKGGNNNSYSRSNSGNFGKQNQQQNQQQQNNNRSVRFPSKHHQRNGGGGGREPKQTVLGQQLHFEDNNGYQQYSTRGGYLGGGGYRGNRRNNNHKTTHAAAANNGSNHGKVSAKERFVQANSQFVMSPFNDNSEHLKDPDAPITWGLVEEVIFSSNSGDDGLQSSSIVCPVCLSTPVAGKVTRCGHIYCWSCILHYLALSDKDSRACPICFETISKGELKSVCIVNRIDYSPADHLTFALMKVRKGCTLALPADFDFAAHGSSPNHRIQRGTNGTLDQFAKVFTASSHYMTAIFDRERADLTEQLLEYEREQMPEVCFVHGALEELAKRQEDYEAMGSSLALCQQLASLEASLSCSTEQQNSTEASAADYNYFYQSEDGQSIYLHPLNVRMLKAEYGELKSCPARITAKIVDLHGEGVHGPAKERRYVYLRHLPLSCEYKIAEVEFTTSGGDEDGVLSPSTVADFAAEVAARKKDRQRKEKALRARDRRIEVENKRKIYGIAAVAPTNFQLDNVADFPAYLPAVDAAPFAVGISAVDSSSTTSSSSNGENNVAAELGLLPELGSSPPLPPPTAGSSFAKMLGNAGGPSANFFDHTLRKKAASSAGAQTGAAAGAGSGEDEDEAAAAALAMQSMNITLGDFFENCIKTKSKKGKGGRKGKK